MLVKKSVTTLRFGEFMESLRRANNIVWDEEEDYKPDPSEMQGKLQEIIVAPVNSWTLFNEDVFWSIISA